MSQREVGDGWGVQWGFSGEGLEDESGDLAVVSFFEGGALLGTIDGLGHGHYAAVAARAAGAVLEAYAGEALEDLVHRCHEELRGTRGVVMSVASFVSRTALLTWCGIGNVEAVLVRGDRAARPPREAILLPGGVVGYQVPLLRSSTVSVCGGDTLVMATDGIKSGFAADIDPALDPGELSRLILRTHARGTDDALVSAMRFTRH